MELHLACHPHGNSKKMYPLEFKDSFSSDSKDPAGSKTPKVTRRGTQATNCRFGADPVGLNDPAGLRRSGTEAGFRTVDEYKKEYKKEDPG